LFIIYGSITLVFGFVVLAILPDSPQTAWFFTAEQKKLVVIRTAENQTGVNSNKVSAVLRSILIRSSLHLLGIRLNEFILMNHNADMENGTGL
jgi:hypothetical protein